MAENSPGRLFTKPGPRRRACQAAGDGIIRCRYVYGPRQSALEDAADGRHQRSAARQEYPIDLAAADSRSLQETMDTLSIVKQFFRDPTLERIWSTAMCMSMLPSRN